MGALLDANILEGPPLFVVYVVAAALVLFVAIGVFGVRGSRQVWAVRVGTAALAGVASGLVLSWLIADVWNLFGAPVSAGTQAWGCAALAGIAVSVNAFWRTTSESPPRWLRKKLIVRGHASRVAARFAPF